MNKTVVPIRIPPNTQYAWCMVDMVGTRYKLQGSQMRQDGERENET